MAKTKSPIEILRDIESRCRSHASDLPSQQEIKEEWIGVGFRLGEQRLVTSLGEVVEILHYPSLSRVPGTKSWVRGVANIRGNLLPVMDLQGFFGAATKLTRSSRVLVVNHDGVYSGLIVDEVLGLKHFLKEDYSNKAPVVNEQMIPFMLGSFPEGDGVWGVFSMHRLAENTQFLHVAV